MKRWREKTKEGVNSFEGLVGYLKTRNFNYFWIILDRSTAYHYCYSYSLSNTIIIRCVDCYFIWVMLLGVLFLTFVFIVVLDIALSLYTIIHTVTKVLDGSIFSSTFLTMHTSHPTTLTFIRSNRIAFTQCISASTSFCGTSHRLVCSPRIGLLLIPQCR